MKRRNTTLRNNTKTVVGVFPGTKKRMSKIKAQAIPFDTKTFLAKVGDGKTILVASKGQCIFSQGDAADAVFYIQMGRVKISVLSGYGKDAIVGILESGSFFGEGCLAGQVAWMATAIALEKCTIVRIDKESMIRVLLDEPRFSAMFMAYVLARNARIQENLVDHLFNSSEKRLARVLLLLALHGKDGKPDLDIPKISHESLAMMIGATRSRASVFLNAE